MNECHSNLSLILESDMSNQQSKRVLVEKHIAANPQATLKSVARATGVSHNYVYKINKDLKDIGRLYFTTCAERPEGIIIRRP